MNLYLLRHAIASEQSARSGFADSKRQLTAEGRQKLRRAAKGMKAFGLDFDVILSSPYLRARQTAEIVAEMFEMPARLQFSEHLKPNGRPAALIQQILKLSGPPDEVLLVGHEPWLSGFLSLLASGGPNCAVAMKKAGLCKLAADALQPGRCATLEWLLTPRQLAMMS
jgi:phosphohistidine phosphatase